MLSPTVQLSEWKTRRTASKPQEKSVDQYVWSYWVENWHDKKTENTIEAAAEDNNSCSYYKIFVSYRQFPVVDGPTGGEAQ